MVTQSLEKAKQMVLYVFAKNLDTNQTVFSFLKQIGNCNSFSSVIYRRSSGRAGHRTAAGEQWREGKGGDHERAGAGEAEERGQGEGAREGACAAQG
jgi:hypothetical protein